MGLLDSFDDPSTVGLLSMASGLLSASGPSRVPVGIGQALGAGVMDGLKGYQQGKEMQRQDVQTAMQNAQLNMLLRRQQMVNDAMAAETQPESAQQYAPNMGAQDAPTQTVQQAGATPLQQGAAPFWPASKIRAFAMSGDPGLTKAAELEQARQLASQTDVGKLLDQAGITDPVLRSQITQQQIAKNAYIAPTSLRPGGYAQYADGRVEQMPHVPDGFQAIKGADGQWHIVPVDGGVGALQTSATAQALGKLSGTLGQGVDAKGNPIYFLGAPSGTATQGNAPPASSSPAVWAGSQMSAKDLSNLKLKAASGDRDAIAALDAYTNAGYSQPQPSQQIRPGMNMTEKTLNEQGAQYYNSAVKEASNLGQYREFLNAMKDLASDPKNSFGPGSATLARIKALANNAGIDMTGAQTAQDVMRKLSSNMVMSQLGQGGTGTDAQMQTLLHSVPNGEMTNDAIKQVVPLLHAQLDMKEARANIINNTVNSEGNMAKVPDVVNTFNKIADPLSVSIGRQMAIASQNGTIKQYMATLQQTYGARLPQIIKKVQQLDGMGAF